MNVFYYLLEANTYLVVFYVFYRIVLKNETFYTLNRFYLLGTTALAFLLPLIKVSGLRKAEIQYVYTGVSTEQPVENFWNTFHIILAVYLVVSVLFLARLGVRLFRITTLIKQGDLKPQHDFKLVEIRDNDLSFSFMNYMFINPDLPKLETIIKHEQVHIRQRHSLDILFFEVLQVINWFNPLIGKMQDDVRAVHEFIADEETASSESSAADYALFLIHNSYGATEQSLSSGMFNRTLLKDRIVMLNQQKSVASAKYKYALVLLLLPLMLCTSAMAFTKEYGFVDLLPQKAEIIMIQPAVEVQEIQQDTIKRKSPPPPPPVAPGSSKASSRASSKSVPPPPPPMPPTSKKLSQQAPPPPPVAPVNGSKQAPPPPPMPPQPKNGLKQAPPPPPMAPDNGLKQAPPPPPMPPQPKNGLKQAPPPPPMAPVKKENKTSSVSQKATEKVDVTVDNAVTVNEPKEIDTKVQVARQANKAIDVAIKKEIDARKTGERRIEKHTVVVNGVVMENQDVLVEPLKPKK